MDLEEINEGSDDTLKNEVKGAASLLDFYKAHCQKSEQDMLDLTKKIDEVCWSAWLFRLPFNALFPILR